MRLAFLTTLIMFWLIELLLLVKEEHCMYQWYVKAVPQGILILNTGHLIFFPFRIGIHHTFMIS